MTSPVASTASSPSTWCRVTPYFTARMPPAFVATLPPRLALYSPGNTGYTSPCGGGRPRRAGRGCTPGCTTATWLSWSISRIAFIRSNETTMPSGRGTTAPERPVPAAPGRHRDARARWRSAGCAATSAVSRGRTTHGGQHRLDGERLVVGVVVADGVAGHHVRRVDDGAEPRREVAHDVIFPDRSGPRRRSDPSPCGRRLDSPRPLPRSPMDQSAPRTDRTAGRDLRFAVIGAGMAGILAAIKLARGRLRRLHRLREGRPARRHVAREHLSRHRVRRAVAPLQLLVRAEPATGATTFSPGAEIQAYFERSRGEHGRRRRGSGSATRSPAATCVDGRWRLETAAGDARRGRRRDRRHRRAAPPAHPDIDGLDDFAGAVLPQRPLGPRRAARRRPASASSAPARPRCRSVGALVDRVGELTLFQRTAQWIAAAGEPAYTDEEQAAFRAEPDGWRSCSAQTCRRGSASFANAVVDADSPEMQTLIEQLCRANLEQQRADPDAARAAAARLPRGVQAARHRRPTSTRRSSSPTPSSSPRRSSGSSRAGVRTARRAAARARRARARDRVPGRRASCGRWTVVGRDGRALDDGVGRAARTPTCRSRSRTSRTSSCSTAPTGRSATSRSSRWPSCSSAYILQLVERLRAGACREISATHGRDRRSSRPRASRRRKNTIWVTGCSSWYLDDRGVPAVWPWTFDRFREEMRVPKPAAYELR